MAEVEAFDAFLDEYETTLKGKREIMECAIEKLTSCIQQEKESCEFDLANYRQQCHPASVYCPLGQRLLIGNAGIVGVHQQRVQVKLHCSSHFLPWIRLLNCSVTRSKWSIFFSLFSKKKTCRRFKNG